MKKLLWALLAVVLVLSTAGCVSPTEEGLVITNTDGSKTVVPENIDRIALLNSNAGEILYLLGESDKIVGISQSIANNAEQAKMYAGAKVIGAWNEPDVEYLISMNVDVVLAYANAKPKNAEVLAASGIPVVYVDCTKPETMVSDIKEIGKLARQEARAAEIAEFYSSVMEEVRAASMLASTHRTVYAESYTAWYGQGTDTGMGQLISWTFGENIMQDAGSKKLSDEWVVTANPQIIIKLVNSMENTADVMQEIEDRRGFDRVSAVQNGQVWLIRNDLTYGPRACVAAVALFEIQYPGIAFALTAEGVLEEFNQRFGTAFETENITYPSL
ncbi:MAG: ABC transporter substrate-binding protein [Methanocorpusculum sp.]|nr:ABC transporter substrate-binding protein [Methanocorpusculum sp.]